MRALPAEYKDSMGIGMADIDEELLTPPGMAAAHAALIAKYEWFLHIKPVRKFDAIKKGGLQPRRHKALGFVYLSLRFLHRTNLSRASAITENTFSR